MAPRIRQIWNLKLAKTMSSAARCVLETDSLLKGRPKSTSVQFRIISCILEPSWPHFKHLGNKSAENLQYNFQRTCNSERSARNTIFRNDVSATHRASRVCQELPRTRQEPYRSTTVPTQLHHSPATTYKTNHNPPRPKCGGGGVSAAWRLQSALGPKAPKACLSRTSFSLSFIFLLMYFFCR